MEDKEQKKTPDGKNFDEDYVTEENSGIKSSVVRARLYRTKKAIGKVEPVHREKQSVREVTDLRYYLDGYLKDNLDEVPKFLAKAWDCVIIVSGNAKVRIGKMSKKGTLVLMADGSWKKVEDIQINDKVISPSINGKNSIIASIVAKEGHSQREMCEVRKCDGTLLYECCSEHNIPVRTLWVKTYRNGKQTEYIWKDEVYSAKELSMKDKQWYKNHCPKTITAPIITAFQKENCKINPYLIGIYLGDGNISSLNQIGITTPSKEVFEWLNLNTNIKRISKRKCPTIYIEYLNTKELERICGKGAYKKFISEEILSSDYEYRKKVFEGLLDTDAYINPEGYVVYTTASKQLADGVKKLAKTLGCRASIDEVYKNCQSFEVKRRYYNVNINVGVLSRDLLILKQERKKRILNLDLDNIRNRESQFENIVVTKSNTKADGFCIQVDSESNLYITDDYVVQHNSTIAMQIAYYLAWLLNEQRKKKGEVPQDTLVPFTNENVAFDPEELMKKAITLPRHSVLVYDEGRAGLDSARAMENINKATQDFFQECGALGHIIIIVLPDFFKLQETIAVSRSLFLINCYTDKNYNRGFFSFYSEHKKELLYILGKKRYGSTSKYFAVEPNFHGPFVNYFPLDKAIYDENKKKALRKRRKSKLEHKWRLERDSLIYILYKNGNFTTEQIAKHLTNISGVPCSTILIDRAIETITKAVKRENIDYEEDENEDNS